MSAVARAPGADSIPSLNGIRAIAVALVFLAHSRLETIVPGGLGVTIFFVLSGFLITTLMRREFAAAGALGFRAFYLRRVLRLMPPLLIVVAAAGLLSALSLIDGRFTGGGLLSVLFYAGNYFVIRQDFAGLPAGLGVTWSLAVEEHYYLLYPPLALLLLRDGRRSVVAAVLGALCVAVLAWRCWLAAHGASEAWLTMATDTRVDAILVGCVMALLRNPVMDAVAPAHALRDGAIAAACGAVLLATLLYRDEVFRVTLRYTLQSLAIAPLIYMAVVRARRWPFRWLNSRVMVYLGTISYTIYLSHQVILYGVEKQWPELGWAGTLLATAALTLAVAEPMRRWVDEPCARLRRRLHEKAGMPAAKRATHAPHAAVAR